MANCLFRLLKEIGLVERQTVWWFSFPTSQEQTACITTLSAVFTFHENECAWMRSLPPFWRGLYCCCACVENEAWGVWTGRNRHRCCSHQHPAEWKAPLSSCFWSSLAVSRLRVNLWGSPTVRLQWAWSLWMLRDDRARTTKLNSHSLSLPLEVLPVNLKDLCIIQGFAFCCHNESDLLSVV